MSTDDQESQCISEDLDRLLARLPDDAWSIGHEAATDYRVSTITIDWRKVPGQTPLRLVALDGDRKEPLR